jgi:hypothetical protein
MSRADRADLPGGQHQFRGRVSAGPRFSALYPRNARRPCVCAGCTVICSELRKRFASGPVECPVRRSAPVQRPAETARPRLACARSSRSTSAATPSTATAPRPSRSSWHPTRQSSGARTHARRHAASVQANAIGACRLCLEWNLVGFESGVAHIAAALMSNSTLAAVRSTSQPASFHALHA